MKRNYEAFEARLLSNELPEHERQAINAACLMLKELMSNLVRDVRRK